MMVNITNLNTGETHQRITIYTAAQITEVPMRILDLIISGRVSIRELNGWSFEFCYVDSK
jgi:hypothetical protein